MKSAVLCVLLMVPSLTKVEVRNFPFLYFPRWLCRIHGQLGTSLRGGKRSVIFKCQCFCLSTTFSVTEILPQRDSAKSPLLRLYSQFSFTKILKALHKGFNIYNILEERPKVLLKMFLISYNDPVQEHQINS